MGVVHTRDQALDNKAQYILFVKPGIESHPIITHPNVTILARCRAEMVNYDKPPGYPNYTIDSNRYSGNNAVNIGKRWADWFEYQGLYKGMGQHLGGLYGGAIYCQNWGTLTYSPSGLMKHPSDAASGHFVGYHSNGTDTGGPYSSLSDIRTLQDFVLLAFQTMKTECDNRNLCYPMYLGWDWENGVYPFDLVGIQPSGPGSGPWLAAVADSRYSTEEVYEEWDGQTWISKTLEDAFLEAGSPAHDPSVYAFQGINRTFVCKMTPYYMRILDHALNISLYEPARSVFPEIICGNYNIWHPLSSVQNEQMWEAQNSWMRMPKATYQPGRYLRADYSGPVCYSPNMLTGNPARYNPAYNVSYPAPEFSGHIFGTTKRDVYRNYNLQTIRANTVGGTFLPAMPWIEPPYEGAANSDYPETHTPDETDILYLLKESYLLGCRGWHVFNPSHSGTDSTTQTRLDYLLSTIEDANTYIRSINKNFRVRGVS
jgi:hypothetical protein